MNRPNLVLTSLYRSPCGDMLLGELDGALCLCDWVANPKRWAVDAAMLRLSGAEFCVAPSAVTQMAAQQLDEYFAGHRRSFDLPLRFIGTEFRRRVWESLCDIPYGGTISYGMLAERLGDRRAVRAVAAAVGANPMSIVVPCHRVVGGDGRLVGYAGGLQVKRFLLQMENATAAVVR